ncbi:MAG: hypothetical protein ACO3RU_15310, partial [Planctomycetota bacterium]
MRTALFSLLVLLPTLGSAALAQSPRALTHDDYDAWPTLSGETPSPDGAWLAYTVGPARGDKTLEVRQVDGETVHRFPRGTSARFTDDSRFLVFGVGSSEDAWRAERVQKLREAIEAGKGKFDEPKKDADADLKQLHILELASGNVTTIDRVESFELLEQTGFVVYVPRPEKKKGDEAKEEVAVEQEKDFGSAAATATENVVEESVVDADGFKTKKTFRINPDGSKTEVDMFEAAASKAQKSATVTTLGTPMEKPPITGGAGGGAAEGSNWETFYTDDEQRRP